MDIFKTVELGDNLSVTIVPSGDDDDTHRYDIYKNSIIIGAFGLTERIEDADELRFMVDSIRNAGGTFE